MYLQSIKSVKHNAEMSFNRSILKKSRHIGIGLLQCNLSTTVMSVNGMSVNGTLVEATMFTFTLESTHFNLNLCPIYTHDSASAKFSTNSHETDYSVCGPPALESTGKWETRY
jgi:hypothetical protein